MNVVWPRIGGAKPAIRLNASLVKEQKEKAKTRVPTVAVYRRQYPYLFKGHHFTFGKQTWDVHALVSPDYMYSRSGLVPDRRCHTLLLCGHITSSCKSKYFMQKCFPFLSTLRPSALCYSLSAIRSPLGLAELALLYPSWSCPNNEQQDPAGMNCCKPQAAEKPASARWEGRSFWLCNRPSSSGKSPRTRSRQQKSSCASLTASVSPRRRASVSCACFFPGWMCPMTPGPI